MSRFPTERIGHVTPRPPIDINPRHAITTGGPAYVPLSADECERLWRLVKGAAEGSNVGDAPAPDPHDAAEGIDTTGWEAA